MIICQNFLPSKCHTPNCKPKKYPTKFKWKCKNKIKYVIIKIPRVARHGKITFAEKRRSWKKMECRGKRGRRGRGLARSSSSISPYSSPQNSKPWSFLSSLYSMLILSSLIGVVYLMLEYHCNNCSSNCDLKTINKSIEDIAKNLVAMRNNYNDLETKISQYSNELPKIEGQIEILEAIATAIENKDTGWNPRSPLTLPNVDVFLNNAAQEQGKNVTKCKCPKRLPKNPPVN